MVYKSFHKKTASVAAVGSEVISKQQFTEKLCKPIIRKFEKRKVHSSLIDNICGADLADMQLLSTLNKGIHFILLLLILIENICRLFLHKKVIQLLILCRKY